MEAFREQVDDVKKPYLFSDDEVLRFAADAQDMYVRLTGGIADSTTAAIVELRVLEGEPLAQHSPHILRIRSAKLLTAKRLLKVAREADLSLQSVRDYGIATPTYLDDTDTGDVVAMVLGVEKNAVRWYKVPTSDDTCRMNVLRLPYPRIDDDQCELEIDEQHHFHLIKWMKHLAYSKEDAETYDKELAESNELAFYRYCGVPGGPNALMEEERQRFRPRVTHYAGL